jgi:hypothetical protein
MNVGRTKNNKHRQCQREGDQRPLHRPFENLLRATVGAGLALFLHSHLGGEQQALDTQPHGVPQECQAAQEGNARQPAAVDARVQRLGVDDDVALRVAHGDRQRP